MSSPGEGKSKHVCESSRAESREEKAKRMILRRSWPIAFAARSVGSDLSRETSLTTNYLNFGSVWVMCMRGLAQTCRDLVPAEMMTTEGALPPRFVEAR